MLLTNKALILAALLVSGPGYTATLYKWVDAEGNVTYQGSPPPAEYQVIEQGEFLGSGPDIDERDQHNRRLAATTPIDLYTTENCEVCDLVRFHLNQLGLPFIEQTLFDNKVAQDQLKERSGGLNAPSLFIGDQLVTSYNLSALEATAITAGFRPKMTVE